MRDLIGLVIGLYLAVALVVFGTAAYSFSTGEQAAYGACASPTPIRAGAQRTLNRGPNWIPWALYRATLWPKTYFDDIGKARGLIDWLLVHYDPLGAC